MPDYIPPLRDSRLELEALILTKAITERDSITHLGDVQAIHVCILRMLIADKSEKDATKNRVLEALGMGVNS